MKRSPDDSSNCCRVTATPAALSFLEEIRAAHGDVVFHQSGGCCDGSSPMCYPAGEFSLGDNDTYLGHVGETPVYISTAQFEAWRHTKIIIDIVPGMGGMFSLDNGSGKRFLSRAIALAPDELRQLDAAAADAAAT